jgi:hypothetical protein
MALTAPKPPMNDKINTFDSMPNSSLPINGTIVYSRPIIAPTNAFTKSRTKNCLMFGAKTKLDRVELTIARRFHFYIIVWKCEFKNILNVGRIWLKFIGEEKVHCNSKKKKLSIHSK